MKTMICLILDRSGSMSGREDDVVGGVNTFIVEQQKLPDPASIALVRFDAEAVERFREMQPLAEVKPLTRADFVPRGGTPLLDAIGRTVAQLDIDWVSERPERAIVMIVTDGQENASREYSKEKIREMITSREASGLWGFVYLGANVDAFAEAGALGMRASNTAGFTSSAAGTRSAYGVSGQSVFNMRSSGVMDANLGRNIAENEVPVATPPPVVAPDWIPPQTSTPVSGAWTPPA